MGLEILSNADVGCCYRCFYGASVAADDNGHSSGLSKHVQEPSTRRRVGYGRRGRDCGMRCVTPVLPGLLQCEQHTAELRCYPCHLGVVEACKNSTLTRVYLSSVCWLHALPQRFLPSLYASVGVCCLLWWVYAYVADSKGGKTVEAQHLFRIYHRYQSRRRRNVEMASVSMHTTRIFFFEMSISETQVIL